MATQLEPLNIRITGSSEGLSTALAGSQNQVRGFAAGIQAISSGFSAVVGVVGPAGIAIGTAFATALPVIHATEAAISHVVEAFARVDETADAANKIGIAFNELKGLRLAIGEATGAEASSVDAALVKLENNLAEAAATGEGAVYDLLKQMGLDAAELIREGPTAAIEAISIAVSQMENPMDQMRVAMILFGKAGAEMVNALRGGPEALKETVNWAEEHLGLTEAQVEAIGRANDQWDRINLLSQAFFDIVAGEVAPIVEDVLLTLIAWSDEIGGVQNLATSLTQTLSGWAVGIADASGAWAVFAELTGQNTTALEAYVEMQERLAANAAKYKEQAANPNDGKLLAQFESQAKAEEAAAKVAKEWERKADAFAKALETPLETYNRTIQELQGALDNGGLSYELFARGVNAAADKLEASNKTAGTLNAPKVLSAATDRADQIRQIAEFQISGQTQAAEAERKQAQAEQLQLARETRDLLQVIAKKPIDTNITANIDG